MAATKTAAPPAKTYSRSQLEEMAKSAGVWWHSIDLGQGIVTKGAKTPEALARESKSLRLPDLGGRTVLDIGAYDGFYSFEAERCGARRVVALDHFVWSLELSGFTQYWRESKARGTAPLPAEETPYWDPVNLPGKRPYDTAHKVLGSRVETVVDNYMTMNLAPLGTFDVVFFLGVLYHMENPLESLQRLASVTKGVAIIETHAVVVPGYDDLELCQFYSANQLNGDVSNWWGPNLKALEGMCLAAGFSRVEIARGNSCADATRLETTLPGKMYQATRHYLRSISLRLGVNRKRLRHFRAVVHAWK